MAAMVCGKRSFSFEDEFETYYPSFKKHRCSSFSPFTSKQTLIQKLQQTFPLMDTQFLDTTLEDCSFDIDLAIAKLRELQLASSGRLPVEEQKLDEQVDGCVLEGEDLKWVELFVKEMTCATSVDDAKARAGRALAKRDQQKNLATKQQKELNIRLSQENCFLSAFAVAQHKKLKELEETTKEVEKISGMLSQCREELRMSQMNNYGLQVQLSQAQIGCSSMINTFNFPPDVY